MFPLSISQPPTNLMVLIKCCGLYLFLYLTKRPALAP
jgi:hypothetical protein